MGTVRAVRFLGSYWEVEVVLVPPMGVRAAATGWCPGEKVSVSVVAGGG